MNKLFTNRPIPKEYNKSGIYFIKIGTRCYVGSSVSIQKRLSTHRRRLGLRKHENVIMINCFNKYGEESVYFEVLEYCDKNELLKKEKLYIDLLKPKLNVELNPMLQNSSYKNKKVYQYKLTGEFIREFISTAEAERFYNKSSNKISQCCLKKRKSSYGFLWSYRKVKKINYINNSNKSRIKDIIQFTLTGKKIRTFKSIADAVRFLDLDGSFESNCTYISSCCLDKTNQAFNYSWKFKKV